MIEDILSSIWNIFVGREPELQRLKGLWELVYQDKEAYFKWYLPPQKEQERVLILIIICVINLNNKDKTTKIRK